MVSAARLRRSRARRPPRRRSGARSSCVLERGVGLLDEPWPWTRTDRGTQSIDRSSSMIAPLIRGDRVGLELDLPDRVELLDRVDQPEDAVADQVGLLDVLGQPDRHTARRRT